MGTPYYMSPEQARGMATVDGRSDIYAIGVVLYQATTGQVPFRAETFNELLFKIALEVPPPPHQFVPDIDPDFALIIQRAMSREQVHRFQTCAEFRDALLAWQAAKASGASLPPPMRPSLTSGPALPQPPQPFAQTPHPFTQTPQPFTQTPSPHLGTPPGPLPGMNTPPPQPSGEGAQATGNAWGNASSAGNASAPKPARSMTIVSVLVGVVALGGLGVAGYLFLGGKKDPGQAGGNVAATTPTPALTPAPTPTPTPGEAKTAEAPQGTTTDAPAGSAATLAPTASVGPNGLPIAPSAKPFGTWTSGPKPAGSNKSNKSGGGLDLGY